MQFARGDFRHERGIHLHFAVKVRFNIQLPRLAPGLGGRRLHLADGRVRGAASGGKRKHCHPRPDPQHMPGEPRGGNGNVRKLLDVRFGNHAAVGHEQNAVLADARIFDLHDHAARNGSDVRGGADDLKQRPQYAARDVRCAGDEAVRLMHRQHHRAVKIRLEHRLTRLGLAQAFFAAQAEEPAGEIIQVLAGGGIDDADAVQ